MADREIYRSLDYSVQDVEEAAGGAIALSSDKVEVLMGRMRSPSLSLHGIEGAFSGVGAKTVIPAKVSGKFSIRSVILLSFLSIQPYGNCHVQSCSPANAGIGQPLGHPIHRRKIQGIEDEEQT